MRECTGRGFLARKICARKGAAQTRRSIVSIKLDGLPGRRYSSRQKKACRIFLYVLLARIELANYEINDGSNQTLDYRA